MVDCEDYALSLINNLSLVSHLVLVPSKINKIDLCRHLAKLQIEGFVLNNALMKELMHGSTRLNNDPSYLAIKKLVSRISINASADAR
jgi:hypothetical protein